MSTSVRGAVSYTLSDNVSDVGNYADIDTVGDTVSDTVSDTGTVSDAMSKNRKRQRQRYRQ